MERPATPGETGVGRNVLSESEKDHEGETKEPAVAVALGHDRDDRRPPRGVDGGGGRLAEQILAIALAHGVKVREDAALANLLSSIDIDSDIPVEAFATVAEILTYVYQANTGMAADTDADGLAGRWSGEPD